MIFSYLQNMQSHPSWVCGLKLRNGRRLHLVGAVTPFVGVWIETSLRFTSLASKQVTPFVGVWIETDTSHDKHWPPRSHPSWVCGLKLLLAPLLSTWHRVTPFVGVWIETFAHLVLKQALRVTPFVGVWIETGIGLEFKGLVMSHPSWVCGLKLR